MVNRINRHSAASIEAVSSISCSVTKTSTTDVFTPSAALASPFLTSPDEVKKRRLLRIARRYGLESEVANTKNLYNQAMLWIAQKGQSSACHGNSAREGNHVIANYEKALTILDTAQRGHIPVIDPYLPDRLLFQVRLTVLALIRWHANYELWRQDLVGGPSGFFAFELSWGVDKKDGIRKDPREPKLTSALQKRGEQLLKDFEEIEKQTYAQFGFVEPGDYDVRAIVTGRRYDYILKIKPLLALPVQD